MFSAYAKFWKGYVDFTGRSSRSDYWWPVLVNVIIMFLVALLIPLIGASTGFDSNISPATLTMVIMVSFVFGVYALAIFLPSIAILVRRLRDAGFHWAFIFLSFVPYLGGFALFIMSLMPTKVEVSFDNNFNNPNQP